MTMQIMSELKTLSEDFTTAFTNKDCTALASLMHEDFVLFDPVLKVVSGRDKVMSSMKNDCFDKFQNVSYVPLNIYEEGNTTIIDFEITLDDTSLRGVDIVKWEDGKMKSLDCYYTVIS